MRLALVSPMPPSKSGIADYAAALGAALGNLAEVSIVTGPDLRFDPSAFDQILYQIGNNPFHSFVYELALQHPGVVVLHEPNLHHLVADLTIRRGDWDGYLREVGYDGGEQALVHAQRVRTLAVAPDYAGVPMLRRLLERSRAVVVHSRYAEAEVRRVGFQGPVAVIPHGAWEPQVDRATYRGRLGLDEATPLIGAFGFLKPYKRIRESLRALRRLVRQQPQVKMLLAGEPHPDLPLDRLIESLDLSEHLRLMGFLPIGDFSGFMAACDIVLNLRYPTVGESSGSLLRAFGLGKAVLVSDVGAFAEYPDEICLKVPVDETEEEVLFEYLNMLVTRPGVACAMGERAREWVRKECNWDLCARRYVEFFKAVAAGTEWKNDEAEREILQWVSPGPEHRTYVDAHLTRLEKTLSIIPPGGPEDRILEMGTYLQITPSLRTRLGYGEVRGCYFGPAGTVEHRVVTAESGEVFECDVDLFDAERGVFPYPDGHFSTVLCCELIEHLGHHPMHLMAEVNRILKVGGHMVLTTPNLISLRSISAVLLGYHPGLFSSYLRPDLETSMDERHHREYTPIEIHLLLADSGFEVAMLETGAFREAPRPELAWVTHMLERYGLSTDLRGEGIYAVGRKTGAVRQRYPSWLYSNPEP
jgi:glycosyltransferase involved in cell wall biosynthesis/SAM-dependent methyltransferase